tara:strand:+ start:150 stop:674 length:525 start_codon:yes stop_codon:yes gene_type:complete
MNLKIEKDDFIIDKYLDQKHTSFLYGEANHDSIYKIIKKYYFEDCKFIDIGSGCGKIVVHLVNNLNIFADGIEIDSNRFKKSLYLLDKFNLYDKIDFYNQDFQNIYFGNYDILYCCNLVFTDEDNKKLYKKIVNEFNGIFLLFDFNNQLKKYFLEEVKIKTSWNKGQTIFVFKK